jgi:transcriptional regulator of aromatic amino acid metabolism
VKGAFTGAVQNRTGRFELAHKGTLFIDEVSSMSLPLQSKLLRALQEREVERVGDSKPLKVDIRVVAATNTDLRGLVRAGTFREDLFYRLNVIPVYLPALRVASTVLIDGFVGGAWTVAAKKGVAVLTVAPFATLDPPTRTALTEEGERLLRFIEPDAKSYEIRL